MIYKGPAPSALFGFQIMKHVHFTIQSTLVREVLRDSGRLCIVSLVGFGFELPKAPVVPNIPKLHQNSAVEIAA